MSDNPYLPDGWSVKPDPANFWQDRAEQLSQQNRQTRPQDWNVPAFNAHFNQAEAETERAALNEHVVAVAQSERGGVWKGLRLPPGSKFKPTSEQMVNGEPQQDASSE